MTFEEGIDACSVYCLNGNLIILVCESNLTKIAIFEAY